MLNLYTTPPKKGRSYDVRHIEQQDFRFKSVNMSAVVEQRLQAEEDQKAAEKTSKKKDKKVKKQKKEQPQKPDNNVERRPVSGE